MINKKSSILAVVLGALLSGCASDAQVKLELTPPTNSEVCCTTYSEFPFVQLQDNEDIKFDIDLASPVGSFVSGNSHFAAFRFSDRSQEVKIELASRFIDDSVFAPTALLLDENFQVVTQYKLEDFQTLPSNAFTSTRYIASFRADAAKTPYLVVYTPADLLGESVKVDHPAKVRAKEFGEVMPMVTDPVYTHQLGGKLELEVETLKLRPFRAISKMVEQPAKVVKQEPAASVVKTKTAIAAQPESTKFYISAIQNAVKSNDIPKALSLLDEAKALNIEGAQEAFVKAVNSK